MPANERDAPPPARRAYAAEEVEVVARPVVARAWRPQTRLLVSTPEAIPATPDDWVVEESDGAGGITKRVLSPLAFALLYQPADDRSAALDEQRDAIAARVAREDQRPPSVAAIAAQGAGGDGDGDEPSSLGAIASRPHRPRPRIVGPGRGKLDC